MLEFDLCLLFTFVSVPHCLDNMLLWDVALYLFFYLVGGGMFNYS